MKIKYKDYNPQRATKCIIAQANEILDDIIVYAQALKNTAIELKELSK